MIVNLYCTVVSELKSVVKAHLSSSQRVQVMLIYRMCFKVEESMQLLNEQHCNDEYMYRYIYIIWQRRWWKNAWMVWMFPILLFVGSNESSCTIKHVTVNSYRDQTSLRDWHSAWKLLQTKHVWKCDILCGFPHTVVKFDWNRTEAKLQLNWKLAEIELQPTCIITKTDCKLILLFNNKYMYLWHQ